MITIQNISKSYEGVLALQNINLDVRKNELFGLIGPDGAGKTSLIRILVTLLLADEGTMNIGGLDVVKDYKSVRNIVGYMPGKFSLYQDLTVEENLNFFASVFGTTIEANYHLIEDIYKQIEPFKKRRAGKLSGGMKQKLALSCALIHKPELLVLDEPTTGVDAVSRKEFWDMLDKLKLAGITIVVSTPYMDEASRCDRVALIQEGKIMTVDTPTDIVEKFGNKILKVGSDDTYKLINDLEKWELTKTVYPFGQFLHVTFKDRFPDKEMVSEYLKMKNHSHVRIAEGFSGIEDVFMDLMGREQYTDGQ